MNKAKNFSKNHIVIVLLVVILLVTIAPYLLKSISWVRQQIEREIEWRRVTEIYKINKAREEILSKYKITTLEQFCASPTDRTCIVSIKIPETYLSYLLGEINDRRFRTESQCKKKNDKYEIFIPLNPRPSGDYFNIDWDFFKPSSLRVSSVSSTPSPTPSAFDLLITELKQKGYIGQIGLTRSSGDNVYYMDKCSRLNIKGEFTKFQEEIPAIEQMIKEKNNETFIQDFTNKSFKNYIILTDELNSVK